MKKLIKTAKQQFEERLSELRLIERWEMCATEVYYNCVDHKGLFVLLRDQDGEYKELQFQMEYVDFVMTEGFLASVVERFGQGKIPVRPLFDWYASADHDNEPFNLLDVYMTGLEAYNFTFEDIYEEIPDAQIVTAKEQWEKESVNAVLVQTLANGSIYKVENTSEYIDFYIYNNGQYFKERFAPLPELRTDKNFTIDYLNHVYSLHDGDIHLAFEWINGGEYKMSELSLLDICEVAKAKTITEYEDKEVITTPIEQLLALTPEQQEAVKMIEEGYKLLTKQGGRIIHYWDENDFYVVNGNNVELDSQYDGARLLREGYIDISNLLESRFMTNFGRTDYWGVDCCFFAKPKN